MNRISHGTYATIAGVVYLGLMTNLLLIIACLPLVFLLVATDPARSWPLVAAALPVCAPALTAAFCAFREFGRGGVTPARAFIAGWRATWRRAVALGGILTVVAVIVLADVRILAGSEIGVAIVPVLAVLAAIVAAVGLIGLVAISETPRARLRDVVKASLWLSLRRWHLTIASLLVLGTQFALFSAMPAIALGLTAAPALYLAWANSRYTLRPVLETEAAPAV